MLVEKYLEQLRKIRASKTVRFKEQALAWLDGEYLPLSRQEVFSLYERMRKELSHSTAVAYLEEIARFFDFLKEEGYNVEFPKKALREIRAKKELKGETRKYFTEEEVRQILDNVRGLNAKPKHPVYYLLCVFLLSSGLRISEALSLKRQDFYERAYLNHQGERKNTIFVKVKGKFSKERETPLFFFDKSHEQIVRRRLEELEDEDFFFTYTIEYPKTKKTLVLSVDAVQKMFQVIEKEVGFPVNAHRFRYTYATWLATKGVPPHLLKDIMGHSSIKTTLGIYTQAQREKLLEVLAGL